MKELGLVISLFLFPLAALASTAPDVSMRVLNFSPTDETNSGIYNEIGLLFPIGEYFGIGTGIGRINYNNKTKTLSQGNITIGDIVFKVKAQSSKIFNFLKVYAEADGGYYIFNHSVSANLSSACSISGAQNCTETLRDNLGSYLGGGISAGTKNLSFEFFGGYLFLNPPAYFNYVRNGNYFFNSSNVDLSTVLLGGTMLARF